MKWFIQDCWRRTKIIPIPKPKPYLSETIQSMILSEIPNPLSPAMALLMVASDLGRCSWKVENGINDYGRAYSNQTSDLISRSSITVEIVFCTRKPAQQIYKSNKLKLYGVYYALQWGSQKEVICMDFRKISSGPKQPFHPNPTRVVRS